MMWEASVLLLSLLPLWVIGVAAPGMVVVRNLRWGPMERLCAAVGVSLFLLYLGALVCYLSGAGIAGHWVMTALCVGAAAWCWKDWVALWRVRAVRQAVAVTGLMLAWGVLCLALVRHYSGGGWASDWALHFIKVGLFSGWTTQQQSISDVREMLIDRPSMMNLVAAYFVGRMPGRCEAFQLVFTWLNLLPVLPCCLLLTRFARRGRRRVWVMAAVLACLPVVWTNATYSWTKLLSGFYVIFGICLYLRGVERGDRGRIVAAFASFAVGVLVHYAALPYGAIALGHYLLTTWRGRPGRWGELGLIVGCGVLILVTWFGWTTARYGVAEVMTANNTLRHARDETATQVIRKMVGNFFTNVVPHPLRETKRWYVQDDLAGYVRDYSFLLYQTNALFVTGSTMGAFAVWLTWRRRKEISERERRFWWGLILLLPVAAAVALDVPSEEGAAHLFFHAWAMVAAVLVAARVGDLAGWARWALAAGLAADFLIGVWLHFYVQNAVFAVTPEGALVTLGRAPQGAINWLGKVEAKWVYFGDLCGPISTEMMVLLLGAGLAAAGSVGMARRGAAR